MCLRAGGYYIYVEANDGKQGDTARLVSVPCPSRGPHCLRFWNHMYGSSQDMALRVYLDEGGSESLKWSKTGNNGNRWKSAEVDLNLSGNSKVKNV